MYLIISHNDTLLNFLMSLEHANYIFLMFSSVFIIDFPGCSIGLVYAILGKLIMYHSDNQAIEMSRLN